MSIDPYLSRPVRTMRAVAVLSSWTIWVSGLYFAFTSRIPQLLLLLIMVCGFMPYILSVQVVEPWLMRRMRSASDVGDRGIRHDG